MFLADLITAKASKLNISFSELLKMNFRKTLNSETLKAMIIAQNANLDLSIEEDIERPYLIGINVPNYVNALVFNKNKAQNISKVLLSKYAQEKIDILKLTQLYFMLRNSYPKITFEEIAERTLKGEDVEDKFRKGEFQPVLNVKDWKVRIEKNGLTIDEIKRLIRYKDIPENSLIYDPTKNKWISVQEFNKSYG